MSEGCNSRMSMVDCCESWLLQKVDRMLWILVSVSVVIIGADMRWPFSLKLLTGWWGRGVATI